MLARRLDAGRALLETVDGSIERVAAECGFASPITLRQKLVSRFATTPTAYRRRFSDTTPV